MGDVFEEFSYEEALKKSSFSYSLSFSPPSNSPTQKRKRSRNIIWFNLPFSMHVSTNIGKNFLKLVCKHFPPAHRYHKIFNKNNLKISYSCMPNMKVVINQQNKKFLSINSSPISNSTSSQPKSPTRNNNPAEKSCNCRKKETCPLNGKCLQKRVLYEATVRTNLLSKSYTSEAAKLLLKLDITTTSNPSKTSPIATTQLFHNLSGNSKNQIQTSI